MTERMWLDATDPRPMIGFLKARLSDRKARLYAVECCRLVWPLLTHASFKEAVETAERFADGLASDEERSGAWGSAGMGDAATSLSDRERNANWWADSAAESAASGCRADGYYYKTAALVSRETLTAMPGCLSSQLSIFRCIAGNPFQPHVCDPIWRTLTALAISKQMYDTRDFGPMPILADALQDAGCESGDILSHCRGSITHVRGCWVVDLLLGKA